MADLGPLSGQILGGKYLVGGLLGEGGLGQSMRGNTCDCIVPRPSNSS